MEDLWTPNNGDPTRIEMDFDASQRRIGGVARHGNTRFSCPLISQVTDDLWQGGCEDGLKLPPDIEYIVSMYPWERYEVGWWKQRFEVVMFDSSDQGLEQVEEIAQVVNEFRQKGTTLVHCQAGLNRSSLVAARALMLDGMTADAAIALLREKRSPACLCNKSFETYLRSLDETLDAVG